MITRNRRHKRGTDWSKLTDVKLAELLSHPHTQGIHGEDYEPYREELLAEQYKRYESRSQAEMKRLEIERKQYQKHLNSKKSA